MSKQKMMLQALCCAFMVLVVGTAAFALDSTNFNPVPVEVKAKSTGGVPVGTIVAWPVATNPEDMDKWLECNGQAVNPTVYPELFALIGANAPDLRNSFLNGASGNVGTASLYRLGIWRPDAVSYWRCGNHGPQHAVLKSWDAASMTGTYETFGHDDGNDTFTNSPYSAYNRGITTPEQYQLFTRTVRYLIRALP